MRKRSRAALVDALESRLFLSATRFAVVGDYGGDAVGYAAQEASVANLIKGWDTADVPLGAIITTGDNNYQYGEWSTIDQNVGKYYADYIGNYKGSYGTGSAVNKFFPTPGNHDWDSTTDHDNDGVKGLDPYLDYFTLPEGTPGNERYYDFQIGPVHFFALDSDNREPDGKTSSSAQGQWLQQRLTASTAPWQVVYFHHAAYSSSSTHGSDPALQWPFAQWGADVIFTGHDHQYERLLVDGIPYFVNGAGGKGLYAFGNPIPESQFRYNADYGAQLIDANDTTMSISFYNSGYHQQAGLVDRVFIDKNAPQPTSTSFQQNVNGYAGTQDTQVQSYYPATDYGGSTAITVDADEPPGTSHDSQGLVRFDDIFGAGAGQIPAGSQIVSATLQLNVLDPGTQVNLHPMLVNWSEADTWNTLSNGVEANGVEAASSATASFAPSATGTYSLDVTASLAAWSADPLANKGWVFLPTNTDGVDFYSSEGSVAPKLVVSYNPPSNLPVVTVTANDATATEGTADDGQFTVSRSGDTTADLIVGYTVGGTATADSDYTALGGTVTIPVGQTSVTIDLIVKDDSVYEGDETAVLTLSTDAAYGIGSPGSATVTIKDNEFPPPVVTIWATDATASEAGDTGTYTVYRDGKSDPSLELSVSYTVGGTAVAGEDYNSLAGSVTIPANQSSATFSVVPIDDTYYEVDETVVVTLVDGSSYDLGTPQSATVTITSDDVEPVAPAAPTDLKGKAYNGGRIDLFWNDNSNNETSFVIEWSLDGKAWGTLDTVGADVTAYTKTGLAKSTFYYFRVKAVNNYGSSAWSNVLKIRSAAR